MASDIDMNGAALMHTFQKRSSFGHDGRCGQTRRDREDPHECIGLMLVTDDLAPPEVSFITSASHNNSFHTSAYIGASLYLPLRFTQYLLLTDLSSLSQIV